MFVKIYLYTDCNLLGEIRRFKLENPTVCSFQELRQCFVHPLLSTSCCSSLRQIQHDELVLFYLDDESDWVRFADEKEWTQALEYITIAAQAKQPQPQQSTEKPAVQLKLKALPASAAATIPTLPSAISYCDRLAVTGSHSLTSIDADQKIREKAIRNREKSSSARSSNGSSHRHKHGSSSSSSGSSRRKKSVSASQSATLEAAVITDDASVSAAVPLALSASAASLSFCGDMTSSMDQWNNDAQLLTADTITSSSSSEDESEMQQQASPNVCDEEEDGEFVIVRSEDKVVPVGSAAVSSIAEPSALEESASEVYLASKPQENAKVASALEAKDDPLLYSCDNCKKHISGARYHCTQCEDYDLCESCVKMAPHAQHSMLIYKQGELVDELVLAPAPAASASAASSVPEARPVFQQEPESSHAAAPVLSVEEQTLFDMGFTNSERNKALLQQCSNDINRAIAMLLE